jgi:hypothetical protein
MTPGLAFIVEQVQPESGLVATLSLPGDFDGQVTWIRRPTSSTGGKPKSEFEAGCVGRTTRGPWRRRRIERDPGFGSAASRRSSFPPP